MAIYTKKGYYQDHVEFIQINFYYYISTSYLDNEMQTNFKLSILKSSSIKLKNIIFIISSLRIRFYFLVTRGFTPTNYVEKWVWRCALNLESWKRNNPGCFRESCGGGVMKANKKMVVWWRQWRESCGCMCIFGLENMPTTPSNHIIPFLWNHHLHPIIQTPSSQNQFQRNVRFARQDNRETQYEISQNRVLYRVKLFIGVKMRLLISSNITYNIILGLWRRAKIHFHVSNF